MAAGPPWCTSNASPPIVLEYPPPSIQSFEPSCTIDVLSGSSYPYKKERSQ